MNYRAISNFWVGSEFFQAGYAIALPAGVMETLIRAGKVELVPDGDSAPEADSPAPPAAPEADPSAPPAAKSTTSSKRTSGAR